MLACSQTCQKLNDYDPTQVHKAMETSSLLIPTCRINSITRRRRRRRRITNWTPKKKNYIWKWKQCNEAVQPTFHPSFWRIECSNMIIKKLCIRSSISPKLGEVGDFPASIWQIKQQICNLYDRRKSLHAKHTG